MATFERIGHFCPFLKWQITKGYTPMSLNKAIWCDSKPFSVVLNGLDADWMSVENTRTQNPSGPLYEKS